MKFLLNSRKPPVDFGSAQSFGTRSGLLNSFYFLGDLLSYLLLLLIGETDFFDLESVLISFFDEIFGFVGGTNFSLLF
jgi:hypothetical protein